MGGVVERSQDITRRTISISFLRSSRGVYWAAATWLVSVHRRIHCCAYRPQYHPEVVCYQSQSICTAYYRERSESRARGSRWHCLSSLRVKELRNAGQQVLRVAAALLVAVLLVVPRVCLVTRISHSAAGDLYGFKPLYTNEIILGRHLLEVSLSHLKAEVYSVGTHARGLVDE